jgi:hypothetical protein
MIRPLGATTYDPVRLQTNMWLGRLMGSRRCVVRSITVYCIEHAEPEPAMMRDEGLRVVEIMHPALHSMARRGAPGGVTTHFRAGDSIDP